MSTSQPPEPCAPHPCAPHAYATPVTAPSPSRARRPSLLGPDDPAPFLVENADGPAPMVVVCDHGGRAVPKRLAGLGLPAEAFDRHIAWDIGALAVARLLARRFDAPLVSATYSRLVIDANRPPIDPTIIPVVSDGMVIPGNRALDAEAVAERIDALFTPYHDAVAKVIARRRAAGTVPAIVSVHSFTPVMRGFARPWHVGILYDGDERMATRLMAGLAAQGWRVGANEPYSGRGTLGGTIETHALPAGLPNVLVEMRQDLIADAAGAATWARALGDALEPILADPDIHRVRVFDRIAPD